MGGFGGGRDRLRYDHCKFVAVHRVAELGHQEQLVKLIRPIGTHGNHDFVESIPLSEGVG